MINIYLAGSKIFVWNPQDVMKLRTEHRIVGSLSGIYPIKPFQIQTKWLPMQLMMEEAKLLIDKGIAQLIRSPGKITDPALIKSYFSQREKLCEEQVFKIVLLKENRQKIIMEKADEIYEGKKRKWMETLDISRKNFKGSTASEKQPSDKGIDLSDVAKTKESKNIEETNVTEKSPSEESDSEMQICEDPKKFEKETDSSSGNNVLCDNSQNADKEVALSSQTCNDNPPQVSETTTEASNMDTKDDETELLDKKTVIDAELAKVPEVSKELCMVQLFTECPWKNVSLIEQLRYPTSEKEKLRSAVFKDLWEKNYYITGGIKFGGDFLAYEGDPLKYHAAFIVVCQTQSTIIKAIDILTYGRLGHQVKKTVAFASLNQTGNVEYISINWAGE